MSLYVHEALNCSELDLCRATSGFKAYTRKSFNSPEAEASGRHQISYDPEAAQHAEDIQPFLFEETSDGITYDADLVTVGNDETTLSKSLWLVRAIVGSRLARDAAIVNVSTTIDNDLSTAKTANLIKGFNRSCGHGYLIFDHEDQLPDSSPQEDRYVDLLRAASQTTLGVCMVAYEQFVME